MDATGLTQNPKGRDQETANSILPKNPHQSLHSPTALQNTQELNLPEQRNYSETSQENPSTERIVEIPELEDDWEENQFNDADTELLDHQNTLEQNNCIQQEYS